jgi:iron uptake system EfeUOB component EfeO/EfeM
MKVQDTHHEDSIITIGIKYMGREFTVEISQSAYEKWLQDNDKLSYVEDYSENGEHRQKTGLMTLDEYWSLYKRYTDQDLVEYIRSHNIIVNGVEHSSIEDVMKWLRGERNFSPMISWVG